MKGRIKNWSAPGQTNFRLPEIARLSVGEKKVNAKGKEYPVSLDYFRLRTDDERIVKAWNDTYPGGKPSKLLVSFFSDDPARVCREELQLRVGRLKYAWGDGETFAWIDQKTKQQVVQVVRSEEEAEEILARLHQEAHDIARANGSTVTGWEKLLTMYVWLPELPIMGEMRLTTKGVDTSIENIRQSFDTIMAAAGTVVRFPFDLTVEKFKSDNMSGRNYPVIDLKPRLSRESIASFRDMSGSLMQDIVEASGGVVRVLSDEIIQESVRRLGAGSGAGIISTESPSGHVPSPEKELEEMAATEEAWIDASAKAKGTPESPHVTSAEWNEIATMDPAEMSLTQGRRYLQLSQSIGDLNQRYGRCPHLHNQMGFYQGYWQVAFRKIETDDEYDNLISEGQLRNISEQDWFKTAAQQFRRK